MAHEAMMPKEIMGQMQEGGEKDYAAMMNEGMDKIVKMVDDLMAKAKEYGVYNDRASINALASLKRDAQAIYEQWMGQQEMGKEKGDNYNPMKLLEVEPRGAGPFSQAVPDKRAEYNAYGGQIFDRRAKKI